MLSIGTLLSIRAVRVTVRLLQLSCCGLFRFVDQHWHRKMTNSYDANLRTAPRETLPNLGDVQSCPTSCTIIQHREWQSCTRVLMLSTMYRRI